MCYLTLNFKYRCLKLFQLTTAFLPLWSSRYQSPSSTTVLFFYAVPPSLPSPLLPFDHRPPPLVEIPFSSQPSAAVGIKDGRFNFHRDNAEHSSKNDTCSPVYQQVAGFVASDRTAVQFLNGTTYLYHSFLDRWTFLVVLVTDGLLLLRLEPQVALLWPWHWVEATVSRLSHRNLPG